MADGRERTSPRVYVMAGSRRASNAGLDGIAINR
jgi:hypothetical protein